MVVPQAHDEDHGLLDGLAELSHAALVLKDVAVVEGDLLGLAELRGDGIARVTGDGRLGVGNHLAVLDVEPLDLGQLAVGSLDELGHDGELLGGVDRHPRPVEGAVALAVRVEVAPVRVAGPRVARFGVGASAVFAFAPVLAYGRAGVRGVGRRDGVCFPAGREKGGLV